jgi:hypothetical protein
VETIEIELHDVQGALKHLDHHHKMTGGGVVMLPDLNIVFIPPRQGEPK